MRRPYRGPPNCLGMGGPMCPPSKAKPNIFPRSQAPPGNALSSRLRRIFIRLSSGRPTALLWDGPLPKAPASL